jgi:hypothetical protein
VNHSSALRGGGGQGRSPDRGAREAQEMKRLGKFYFNILSERKCAGCNQTIRYKAGEAALNALGSFWHSACFVCHTCKKPIATSGFARIDDEVTTPIPCESPPIHSLCLPSFTSIKSNQHVAPPRAGAMPNLHGRASAGAGYCTQDRSRYVRRVRPSCSSSPSLSCPCVCALVNKSARRTRTLTSFHLLHSTPFLLKAQQANGEEV